MTSLDLATPREPFHLDPLRTGVSATTVTVCQRGSAPVSLADTILKHIPGQVQSSSVVNTDHRQSAKRILDLESASGKGW
jgi:hypothetical protein